MIRIKSIGLAGLVLAAGVLSPVVMAQPPSITGTLQLFQGPYSYDVGGEFTAVSTPGLDAAYMYTGSQVVQTVGGNVGFQTFCLQTSVDFYPGNTYNYLAASLNTVGSPQNGIPLSAGVAWLYGEFAQGKLNGYDYANSGTGTTTAGLSATRQTDAGALQAAIWALMGEAVYGDGKYVTPTAANNIFYADALNEFGGSLALADASVTAASYGLYNVGILNLSDSSGSAQNQLVWFGGEQDTAIRILRCRMAARRWRCWAWVWPVCRFLPVDRAADGRRNVARHSKAFANRSYPLLLKPRAGSSGAGFRIAKNCG